MDSLTHIVLGAAIGEAVLGKKIGNRALLWGAIGETIPDLDVFGNLFLKPMDALAFHRSYSHSLLFSVLAPLLFSWLVFSLYHTDSHKSRFYKLLIFILNLALIISLVWIFNFIFSAAHHPRWWLLLISIGFGVYLAWRLYAFYLMKDLESPRATWSNWYFLFFLTFLTHILLDSCTAFGTQVLQPFSDYRLAFNNIAVADPAYTLPFLICTIVFILLRRGSKSRAVFNWLGIGISSFYLLLTFVNKYHVDKVFEHAIENRKIDATRCRTSPTILNNLLWTCVAEDTHHYYVGQYSIFDSDSNLHYLNVIPKNDSLQNIYAAYRDYQTIRWFSDGYLAIYPGDSITVFSDLRYGGLTDTLYDYHDMVFNFLAKEEHGTVTFSDYREPLQGDIGELLLKFIHRIKGY